MEMTADEPTRSASAAKLTRDVNSEKKKSHYTDEQKNE